MEGCSGKEIENDIIRDDRRKDYDATANASVKDKTRNILENNIMDTGTGIDKSLWDKFVLCGVNPTLLNSYMTLINNKEKNFDKYNKDNKRENNKNNDSRSEKDAHNVKHTDLACDKSNDIVKEKSKRDGEADNKREKEIDKYNINTNSEHDMNDASKNEKVVYKLKHPNLDCVKGNDALKKDRQLDNACNKDVFADVIRYKAVKEDDGVKDYERNADIQIIIDGNLVNDDCDQAKDALKDEMKSDKVLETEINYPIYKVPADDAVKYQNLKDDVREKDEGKADDQVKINGDEVNNDSEKSKLNKPLFEKFVSYGVNPELLGNYMTLVNNRDKTNGCNTVNVNYNKKNVFRDKMKNKNRKDYSKEFKAVGNNNEHKFSRENNLYNHINIESEPNFEDKHDKSSKLNANDKMMNDVGDLKNIHETDCDRYTFQATGDTKNDTGDKMEDTKSFLRHDVEDSISKNVEYVDSTAMNDKECSTKKMQENSNNNIVSFHSNNDTMSCQARPKDDEKRRVENLNCKVYEDVKDDIKANIDMDVKSRKDEHKIKNMDNANTGEIAENNDNKEKNNLQTDNIVVTTNEENNNEVEQVCSNLTMENNEQCDVNVVADADIEETVNEQDILDLDQFDILKTIGKGAFASVSLCVHKPSSQYYALKMLSQKACKAKQVEHVQCEMDILQGINHPFLIPLLKSSMEGIRPILLFPYISGGSLYAQLKKARKFPTSTVLFFSAEIVSALSYLHSLSIVHRDLKPKNILLDKEGHVVIIDFGFSKKIQQRSSTLCGTQAYLAPEIIECVGHDQAVDWWALGIIIYEMLVGYPPFFDDNPFLVSEKILSEKLKWPRRMDTVAKDFIEKLLDRDKMKRLGSKDTIGQEVKTHKFFHQLDWEDVYHKRLKPPIVPKT